MKKAVLYARVSSDLQKKEKTIESQILELRKQITKAGDALVKEYIDNGYSGARLDRPAMDELRRDLKTNLFDTIYFLNTDRIAREVTYQTIIVAEILKYRKQLIINGKDYIHNPENKFTLTVLGAVSELERAKISERVARGKALKLAQGCNPGRGSRMFGYDFVHKAPDTVSASFTINEREAEAVRLVFAEYSKGGISTHGLALKLEEKGFTTKQGYSKWHSGVVKNMLRNSAYIGTMYFNKLKLIREYADPVYGRTTTTEKLVPRDRSEWVSIPVPPIISKELFDQVQERITWNEKNYRNQPGVQLLSNLIKCGTCGSNYTSIRSKYLKPIKNDQGNMVERAIYVCNRRIAQGKGLQVKKQISCHTKQIASDLVENKVLEMIETTITNPDILKTKISVLQGKTQNAQLRVRRRLTKLEKEVATLTEKKKRIIDLYTEGELSRESYAKKLLEKNAEIVKCTLEKSELLKRLPVLQKEEVIDKAIKQYCNDTCVQYQSCTDFETKRRFLLDHIEKVIHDEGDGLTLYGFIPIPSDGVVSKLEFRIKRVITKSERLRRKLSPRLPQGKASLM